MSALRSRMSRSEPLDTGCPIPTVLDHSETTGRTSSADHDGRVEVKRLGEGRSAVLGRLHLAMNRLRNRVYGEGVLAPS